jgi:outer membrane protein insertion porin family
VKPGEPFSREKLAESTKAIAERLGNEGYAFANANAVPDVNKDKRTVAFTIMIDPGRRVYVRRINVVGNTKTRDEVVRRELRQLEGAFYDGQKLQLSRQRVDKLNFFDSVELETEPVAGVSDQVDINLKVKEKATGNLLFGVGFSSSDGLILQGSLSQANIFGSGNSMGITANTSKVNRNIGLSFTNPYFTVDGVSAGVNLYNRRFDADALDVGNYITETLGGGVQFGYPTAEFDRVTVAVALERTKIDLFADSPQRFIDFVNQNGSDPLAMPLSVAFARDRRDSAIFPTSGTFQRIFTEVTLPGFDLKYYKLGYQVTWYYPFTRDVIGMLNGLIGYGGGYSGNTLPFFKAYYAGGPGTVRGYETASLGPRDPQGATGGSRQAVGNAELTFPFPGMGQDRSLRLGAFFDAGQVWTDQAGFGFGDKGTVTSQGVTVSYDLRLRYSAGAIIAWNSPLGPLRLFYAIPLNDQPGDQLQRFQFVFGHTF